MVPSSIGKIKNLVVNIFVKCSYGTKSRVWAKLLQITLFYMRVVWREWPVTHKNIVFQHARSGQHLGNVVFQTPELTMWL